MTDCNVLILVQNLSVPFDRRVWNEATSLNNEGYKVFVVCPSTKMDPESRAEINGIKIFRFLSPPEGNSPISFFYEYFVSIMKSSYFALLISMRHKINIVHICNPPDLLFIPALVVKMFRKSKIIYDQHDLCPELVLSKGFNKKSIYYRASILFEQLTYKLANAVISTNQSYKSIAINRGKKNTDDVVIVRSGPRINFGLIGDKLIQPSDSCRQLIYLGTMGIQEGVTILVEMMENLLSHPELQNLVLNIVGGGPEERNLQDQIANKRMEKNVVLHGRISDEDLRNLLKHSDIALNSDVPSDLNDLSTMNKVIEYMGFGIPIVQYKATEAKFSAGLSSVYLNEYSANTFAVAVRELIYDPSARKLMSNFGLQRFRADLAWETQEHALISFYEHVSKNKSSWKPTD